MTFIQSGISLLQWELTFTSVLDNVQDRVGRSHLAYLCVPYMLRIDTLNRKLLENQWEKV
jgi:hypothetical protein